MRPSYARALPRCGPRAYQQKHAPPGEIFVPNRHLDLFEKLPIAGITNGMSDANRPEHLPELQAEVLRRLQERRGALAPLFANPTTQREMLARDHTFDAQHLEVKAELKRLLISKPLGMEPLWDPMLLTAVGRLVEQKNLGLVADIIERTLAYDAGTKFIILASAPDGDGVGKGTERPLPSSRPLSRAGLFQQYLQPAALETHSGRGGFLPDSVAVRALWSGGL